MTDYVARLRIAEDVCIQTEALSLLKDCLGTDGSQDVIERAIVEVAERMGSIEKNLLTGDIDQLKKSARSLGSIGEQLGFILVAKVANDVLTCIEQSDLVALHAVTERLMRIGDASLTAAIDRATLPT